ncbi:hypothetical protein ACTFIW_005594 [Dictyostelium discoideum]
MKKNLKHSHTQKSNTKIDNQLFYQTLLLFSRNNFDNSNNNSSNVNNNYQVTSNISIIAIREVNSVNGEQVKIHYIDKWYYNSISSTISNYQSTIINNNITTTINATLGWFENKSNITFENQRSLIDKKEIKK